MRSVLFDVAFHVFAAQRRWRLAGGASPRDTHRMRSKPRSGDIESGIAQTRDHTGKLMSPLRGLVDVVRFFSVGFTHG